MRFPLLAGILLALSWKASLFSDAPILKSSRMTDDGDTLPLSGFRVSC